MQRQGDDGEHRVLGFGQHAPNRTCSTRSCTVATCFATCKAITASTLIGSSTISPAAELCYQCCGCDGDQTRTTTPEAAPDRPGTATGCRMAGCNSIVSRSAVSTLSILPNSPKRVWQGTQGRSRQRQAGRAGCTCHERHGQRRATVGSVGRQCGRRCKAAGAVGQERRDRGRRCRWQNRGLPGFDGSRRVSCCHRLLHRVKNT
jgi:hypothetical protein